MIPIEPLQDTDAFLSWLLEGAPCPGGVKESSYCYAVCQCFDTFVWGVRANSAWSWASDAAVGADIRPPLKRTLLEARIFGAGQEMLIWREREETGDRFRGRLLRADALASIPCLRRLAAFQPAENQEEGPTEMAEQGSVGVTQFHGFARRELGNGRITFTPPGIGVLIHEYLEEQPDTGVVRVAMTRFVDILRAQTAQGAATNGEGKDR